MVADKINNQDKVIHGIWRIVPSVSLTEIIAQAGFDFQILDCEHGGYDNGTLLQDIIACEHYGCSPFVRVSGLNKVEVQRCLDMGAQGIVFPQLEQYEDFETAVQLLHYAPEGVRGYNPFVRSAGYGIANDKMKVAPMCIVIIETRRSLDEIRRIVALPGIDMIYIGAYDLSAQLGRKGQMDSPELVSAIESIIDACQAAGKPVSLMVHTGLETTGFYKKGVRVFVHAVESSRIKSLFLGILNEINIER